MGETVLSVLRCMGVNVCADCGGAGKCGKCVVTINGKRILACRTEFREDMEIEDIKVCDGIASFATVSGVEKSGVAVDIGTTTVAAAVFEENGIVRAKNVANPQRKYGADVMSRIGAYPLYGREMTDMIRQTLETMLTELGVKSAVVVTGNTAMLSIFAGFDCTSLGFAPYAFDDRLKKGFSIEIGKFCYIFPPCVSGFIGADVYCCALEVEDMEIIADLGTNGEIILFAGGTYFCASAAAGPAFEGGGISCGMAAVEGAVSSVRFDGAFQIETIGNKPPVGICGSGLIDVIAECLKNNFIDETGKIDSYFDGQITVCKNVIINQSDVRQVQLTKGAIRAAIEVLIKKAGVTDIKRVRVAGGFSAGNMDSMFEIGLFPPNLAGKVETCGNLALTGAARHALIKQIDLNSFHVINLGEDESFTDIFVESMTF